MKVLGFRHRAQTLLTAFYFRAIILVATALLCSGCIIGNRPFDLVQATVSQRDGDIFFDLSPPKTGPSVKFHGVVVLRIRERDGASDSEDFWRVQADTRKFRDDARLYWPLRYGEKIANTTQVSSPKKLGPGRYRLYLDVLIDAAEERSEDRGVKSLTAEFSIDENLKLAAQ